jgi:hypothetical protein
LYNYKGRIISSPLVFCFWDCILIKLVHIK